MNNFTGVDVFVRWGRDVDVESLFVTVIYHRSCVHFSPRSKVRFAYLFHRRLGLTTWTDDSWRIIKYGSLERKGQLVRRKLSNDRRRKNGDEFFLYFRTTQLFHHQANVFSFMFLLRSARRNCQIHRKKSVCDWQSQRTSWSDHTSISILWKSFKCFRLPFVWIRAEVRPMMSELSLTRWVEYDTFMPRTCDRTVSRHIHKFLTRKKTYVKRLRERTNGTNE